MSSFNTLYTSQNSSKPSPQNMESMVNWITKETTPQNVFKNGNYQNKNEILCDKNQSSVTKNWSNDMHTLGLPPALPASNSQIMTSSSFSKSTPMYGVSHGDQAYFSSSSGLTNNGDQEYNTSNHLPQPHQQELNQLPSHTSITQSMPPSNIKPSVYSRKVFVGGLPTEVPTTYVESFFQQYGDLTFDWPPQSNAARRNSHDGYAFIVFENEDTIHHLVNMCSQRDGNYYLIFYGPYHLNGDGVLNRDNVGYKAVQIRPWEHKKAEYCGVSDDEMISLKNTVFIGAVPRPIDAHELAVLFDNLFKNVIYASIDCDPIYHYPKGAARVVFSDSDSTQQALHTRFVYFTRHDQSSRITDGRCTVLTGKQAVEATTERGIPSPMEIKPYMFDNQPCEQCSRDKNKRSDDTQQQYDVKPDFSMKTYYCAEPTCNMAFCLDCWIKVHDSWPARSKHEPLVRRGMTGQKKLIEFNRRRANYHSSQHTFLSQKGFVPRGGTIHGHGSYGDGGGRRQHFNNLPGHQRSLSSFEHYSQFNSSPSASYPNYSASALYNSEAASAHSNPMLQQQQINTPFMSFGQAFTGDKIPSYSNYSATHAWKSSNQLTSQQRNNVWSPPSEF